MFSYITRVWREDENKSQIYLPPVKCRHIGQVQNDGVIVAESKSITGKPGADHWVPMTGTLMYDVIYKS